jgi:hypothetical protein
LTPYHSKDPGTEVGLEPLLEVVTRVDVCRVVADEVVDGLALEVVVVDAGGGGAEPGRH